MTDQPRVINVNVSEEGSAVLDALADRFKVSRAAALRWVLQSIDVNTFLPSGFLNATNVSETRLEKQAA